MERLIRRLLAAWLVLLGSVLLAQYAGGSSPLVYWLFVVVAGTAPVVVGLLLWLVGLRLLAVSWRVRVLWRAARWKRTKRAKRARPGQLPSPAS